MWKNLVILANNTVKILGYMKRYFSTSVCKFKIIIYLLLIINFNILPSVPIFAQENEDSTLNKLFLMSVEELLNLDITIATKSNQPLKESPSSVSVVTAKDIKNMGARELEDILQTIPGFELTRNYGGYYGTGVRGVRDSRITTKILYMIDGIPFNQIFFGNTIQWGYDINIDAIDRIEIIRGPGSALYGRNAFSAVVNIITKTAQSGEKLMVKGSLGTLNAMGFSGFYGYKKDKFNAAVAVRKIKTDVTDVKFDNGYGEIVPLNIFRNNLTINTNIGFGKFTVSGSYSELKGGAVFSDTKITDKIGNYALSYSDTINSILSINARAFGHNSFYMEDIEQMRSNLQVVIPTEIGGNGTMTYADIYPNGIYYQPQSDEYLYGMEADIRIKLIPENDLFFGLQADYHGVKNVIIPSNFNFATGQPFPGMTRQNMEKYAPGWFDSEGHSYHNIAFIIQDIWYPVKKIGITVGGRFDIDSEIGGVLSPRAGVVLEPFKNFSCKFLFGRAYRAPSPSEQFTILGYAIGNKFLEPEIINTYEIALSYRFEKMLNTISLYRNKLSNMIYAQLITFVDPNNKFYNIGKNTSTGVEYEAKLFWGQHFYSYLNYSYSISENTETIDNVDSVYSHPNISPHKLNLGMNISLLKYFKLNANMFYRSEMERYMVGNTGKQVQDNIGNYALVNSTLQIENLLKNFTLSFSAYNIFDTKYHSQDNQHFNQPAQPGRQFIVELSYTIRQ